MAGYLWEERLLLEVLKKNKTDWREEKGGGLTAMVNGWFRAAGLVGNE